MVRRRVRKLGAKRESIISQFKGLHTAFGEENCPEGYSPFMKNISADAYPELKTREGRELFTKFEGEVLFLGAFEGKYLSLVEKTEENCVWKYYDNGWKEICKVSESPTKRYDMIYFINATILVCGAENSNDKEKSISYAAWFEDGDITVKTERNMPVSDMIDTINGRLAVAFSGDDKVYLGGIMDRTVWFKIDDGLEQSVITQNCENISAIKSFGGHLVCFKPHSFGEIYGNSPESYTMIMVSESIGCISEKTICDCGRLLWLSSEGVCSYGGGTIPKIISQPIQKYVDNIDFEKIDKACAGYDGKRYILTLPQKDGGCITCVLNVETGIWVTEDEEEFNMYCMLGDDMYASASDGRVIKLFTEGEEQFHWEWKSKIFGSGVFRKKGLRRIYVEAETDGEINISITNDKGEECANEVILKNDSKGGKRRFYIDLHPVYLGRCNTFQITLRGVCKSRIIAIGMIYRNKNISYI